MPTLDHETLNNTVEGAPLVAKPFLQWKYDIRQLRGQLDHISKNQNSAHFQWQSEIGFW